uniref:(northern house mosquito) hypothetical protein n=1 Tax=Culex pipiens TaxID=7175 RepID=A0A8D8FRM6_CULPI
MGGSFPVFFAVPGPVLGGCWGGVGFFCLSPAAATEADMLPLFSDCGASGRMLLARLVDDLPSNSDAIADSSSRQILHVNRRASISAVVASTHSGWYMQAQEMHCSCGIIPIAGRHWIEHVCTLFFSFADLTAPPPNEFSFGFSPTAEPPNPSEAREATCAVAPDLGDVCELDRDEGGVRC